MLSFDSSDPSSLLGVRLPPDTEIIKYTSSIVGPKIPGTTNRGRKKTISLEPNPLLATLQGLSGLGVSPAKRARLEAVAQQQQQQQQSRRYPDDSQTIAINCPNGYRLDSEGVSAAYRMDLPKSSAKESAASLDTSNDWTGLNLSSKASTASSADEGDAPLNLCMKSSSDSKPTDFSSSNSTSGNGGGINSLQSLSSITAALGSGSGNDRMRE